MDKALEILEHHLKGVTGRIQHLSENRQRSLREMAEWEREIDELGVKELDLEKAIHTLKETNDD